jgi:hypothetical protein
LHGGDQPLSVELGLEQAGCESLTGVSLLGLAWWRLKKSGHPPKKLL